ncbi:hypothetical protein T02_7697 [Trichinella nativa]|uniref:Uncharacterized protein n=1 Tax=Trichinella nativa TaxID=6335 RepID=A0A0V1KR47_9BILA|nr:hypothetical protein T02_7697 [Trichinella nativa]
MDSLLTDVNLGTDFMTKYGIRIDLGGRKIFGPSLSEIHILADNPAQSCGVGNESGIEDSDHDNEAHVCAIPNILCQKDVDVYAGSTSVLSVCRRNIADGIV